MHGDRLYREALGQCLARHAGLAVVYSAPSLATGNHAWLASVPDVLVVQFGMRLTRTDWKTHLASSPDLKRIVVGVPDTEVDILSCIEEDGAAGYVLLDGSLEELVANVHAVMNGETLCSPRVANLAFRRMSALARRSFTVSEQNGMCLTRREAEIAKLIDDGLCNKEIAVRLAIEVSTVKNHIHNILDKLQVHNRHSAAKYLKSQNIPTNSHF